MFIAKHRLSAVLRVRLGDMFETVGAKTPG
jgi:hypothetical protein